ncbi:hypothetical protein HGRIS_013142 [Hohenbuehelia grisea]|uniref:Non-structural maintenance of chromosomes element 1 homolog n=1 Tax=Hohenbuehelia grisea TaxID=104357 RepID=A0ABR3IUP2_9AGAR
MVSSTDVQKLFLQSLLSRPFVSATLAQTIWARCVAAVKAADPTLQIQHSSNRLAWDDFVARINVDLNGLDLEFKNLHDENTGREMYCLVNLKGDDVAQLATDYTPNEIAFFKAILEQIMLAPHESYCISSLAALREVSNLKSSMTKTQGELLLSSFVAKGWLHKTKRGRYTLSTRTELELLQYLKSTYPEEVLDCNVCDKIITRGIACPNADCQNRMHFHCFATYRRQKGTCPDCTTDWPREATDGGLIPIGEGAARDGQDAKRRVRVRSVDTSDDDSDEGDAEGEDEDEPAATQQSMDVDEDIKPKKEGKGKGKGKARARR